MGSLVVTIHSFSIEELILYSLVSLFAIEQIFYYFFGPYPYRHGLLVKKVALSREQISGLVSGSTRLPKAVMKRNKVRQEIYVRRRQPRYAFGPLVFVGQINEASSVLNIRVGFALAGFIAFSCFAAFFFSPPLSLGSFGNWLFGVLGIAGAVGFFFYWFLSSLRPLWHSWWWTMGKVRQNVKADQLQWFYHAYDPQGGRVSGPLGLAEIREAYAMGKLRDDDLVWHTDNKRPMVALKDSVLFGYVKGEITADETTVA
jgi:hypothetical protein